MFSDREDMTSPDAKHLTFVQSSCPVDEMSEIIDPLANVNEEVYFSKFKTFRFGNQSTVFAHCTVQVCLTTEECAQWQNHCVLIALKVSGNFGEPTLKHGSNAIASSVAVNGQAVEQCIIRNAFLPLPIYVLILFLSMLSVVCLVALVFTFKKLAAYKKLAPFSFGIYR
ncbi:unnamed protein product [Gongylonema pulchrum]|uniref:ZP domain-containing protein n=1 Tax=Gongylonema pulchrum TaxID=637853 RepID=A0A183ENC9_9BILA|nr:unnamed protein product [Gongylonema pulchrum]